VLININEHRLIYNSEISTDVSKKYIPYNFNVEEKPNQKLRKRQAEDVRKLPSGCFNFSYAL
jgi:hypothetical protein